MTALMILDLGVRWRMRNWFRVSIAVNNSKQSA